MFNLVWGILFVAVNFVLFLLCFRLFGRKGLLAWIGFATVLANIQVVKTIEIFGIVLTLGNTIYVTISMTTDLLNEKFGVKAAKQAVWFGFFSLLVSTGIMQMVLAFQPAQSDIAHDAMQTLFELMPRIAIGSLCAYLFSQYLDVKLFSSLRKKFANANQFWIRINVSTGISQFVDTLIFCTIAFAGIYTWSVWIEILLTTYLLKFVISISGTPVLYIARGFKHEDDERLDSRRA